jgi:hypothetical protein
VELQLEEFRLVELQGQSFEGMKGIVALSRFA